MSTHHLQRLSFQKLECQHGNTSLHTFVLIRNSLLRSIQTQQQEDSWLEACFDEADAPIVMESTLHDHDMDMLLLHDDSDDATLDLVDEHIDAALLDSLPDEEEDDDDDDDDDDEDGPVSPEQTLSSPSFYRQPGSPTFFIPMDEDDVLDDQQPHDKTAPMASSLMPSAAHP
ncbi:hypothetical protein BC940DRAFT_312040 [Gongronella butleri]|nr:hypothetical protein BC940DRAFT_312040 [Gongronella butleri]